MLIKIKKKQRDKVLRKLFSETELQRRYYKFMRLVSLNNLDKFSYVKYQNLLSELPKLRYNNRCYVTARSRGVIRKFKLSRHQIREKFRFLHGLTSSSW